MVSLRHHVITIMAIFLALGLGMATGATFVDSVLVNSLEQQVDQQELDTRNAEAKRDEALAERDAIERAAALASERWSALAQRYAAVGQLEGKTVLIVAPRTLGQSSLLAFEAKLTSSRARYAGVLWVEESLRPSDPVARARIADTFSLAGDSEAAVRRALRFLLPQALYEPETAGGSDGPDDVTAFTRLADIGMVSHDPGGLAGAGNGEPVQLHEIGGDGLLLLFVTDAASASANDEFVFPLLADIADDRSGVAVLAELAPAGLAPAGPGTADSEAAGAGTADSEAAGPAESGPVVARVHANAALATAVSTVDRAEAATGPLTVMMALVELPTVARYRAAEPWAALDALAGTAGASG
ncbi:MAG TPA: hypothetical protein DEP69_07100 [Acidimicrobiaceae bacterium]|nr:hypothetical protein [Acidimicrobiaceae bacterium]